MPDERPLLLLTRPRAQSARFAEAFAARFGTGFDVVTAPVLEIAPTGAPIPLDGVSGLIFTSENGVAAFSAVQPDRSLHAWCVGDRTAQAAQSVGFSTTASEGTAEALVRDLASHRPEGRLLHLRGEHAAGDIEGDLAALGFEIETLIVYRQQALPLGPEALARVGAAPLTLVPLFSPRSARLVGEQFRGRTGRLALATMSPAVTAAWAGPRPVALCEAARPDAPAMLDALASLIDAAPAP
ncbi:uroporphyrinogen-III synthase [Rhodovulum euryhalinum]|uniref:Uroporphyrinogen-III synthase n=1 Tax=Rhodovulum euryhalinum TaxID=35805 RepID=A0A4R2KT94_9RHOB|nr:uroporphyrinogen-III synthase [Rhodovulum euryhalinum]TCO73398.1 uroporphyrinogen-III synthase [Rhodovulum euryhalinum]